MTEFYVVSVCPLCQENLVSFVFGMGHAPAKSASGHYSDTRNNDNQVFCPHAELWAEIDNRRIVK